MILTNYCKAFRQRVSYLVHRRIHTGAMPYQCTACNKRFRYKISQRTHKCSVDPPGVVVRTNGSLVERLQAAMIKAAVEVDKDKTKNEVNEENYFEADKLLSRSQNFSSNLDPPICNPTSFSSQSKQMASSSMHNTTGLQYTKASDAEKTVPDKPQIYLLVKGPNEETYYQPLLLSQNSNIFVNNNNNTLSSQKNKLDNVKSKTKKKNDLAINVEQLLTNYVEISNLSEKNKSFALEKEKDLPETMDENTEQVIKSSFHWFINGKKPNNKTEPPHELSTGVVNMLSEDSAMNDIISSLSCELSEAQSNPGSETNFHEVITSKSDYNSDTMMMDSTDIFSLVINPSLYSPSEGLGRLSLSPNTIAHQSMTDHHNDSSEAVKNNFSSNDEQQDSLFDNISDDALKELLFGSPE